MKRILPYIALISLTLYACDEIFEPDISDDQVVVNSPLDSAVLFPGDVIFSWEELQDADEFEVELVQGRFNQPEAFILDTLIAATNVTENLAVGEYEWKIRAVNFAYETEYVVRTFSVIPEIDISNEAVLLINPGDSAVLTSSSVNFNWEEVEGATSYEVEIVGGSFEQASGFFMDTVVTSQSFTIELDSGRYQWHVKGIEEYSETEFSKDRTFDVSI